MNHYKPHDIEAYDIINTVFAYFDSDLTSIEAFYIGNILKYLLRYKYKGQKEDDIDKLIAYAKKLK